MRAAAIFSRFFVVFAAAASAETEPSETVEIFNFMVRKDVSENGTQIDVVDFKLNGMDANGLGCTGQAPAFPSSELVTCGGSKYRFSLHAGTDGAEFSLRIFHDLDSAVGYWGQGNVPTVCRAGGDGPGDYVCSQVAPTTIVIGNTPPPVEPNVY